MPNLKKKKSVLYFWCTNSGCKLVIQLALESKNKNADIFHSVNEIDIGIEHQCQGTLWDFDTETEFSLVGLELA